MKLSALLLFPLLALAAPAPEAAAAPEALAVPEPEPIAGTPTYASLEARAARITCTATADGVRYRTCASTSCTAIGQYPINTRVTFTCYKVGQPINGNNLWVRATNGYYSAAYYFNNCTPTNILDNAC
ncbi:hypothetical protein K440DRAFT_660801 [Wilcoxina mikolae CBS 423.85]|nr:hypothetical protein K440DRAFT_660801 [Wilcoxina mikolae CBS 423.85]